MTNRECALAIRNAFHWPKNPLAAFDETLDEAEALLREHVARATAARDAEVERLTRRCEWQAKAVGILKALLDRSVSVDEFVSRVQAFIAKETT